VAYSGILIGTTAFLARGVIRPLIIKSGHLWKIPHEALGEFSLDKKYIGEIVFDLLYLATLAVFVFIKGGLNIHAAILLAGDSGHLLSRIYAFTHGGVKKNETLVKHGQIISGLAMTIFYAALWLELPHSPVLSAIFAGLCALRLVLCAGDHKYRNYPFFAIGLLIIAAYSGRAYVAAPVAASFVFYALALGTGKKAAFMMLKTICYILILGGLLWMN
jgi:hypothetical protein